MIRTTFSRTALRSSLRIGSVNVLQFSMDQFDGISDRLDRLRLRIGERDPELLLPSHHQLDRVHSHGVNQALPVLLINQI